MEGEFTNYCKRYYELTRLLDQQEDRFDTLVENALPYTGQTMVAELDAIIRCNRKVQEVRRNADEMIASKAEIGNIILQILDYFEIPPNTLLTCEVPGMVELKVWADDNKQLYCIKTKSLDPLENDPNVIVIEMNGNRHTVSGDEDD